MDWEYYNTTRECILALKEQGYTITGIEQTDSSVMLDSISPQMDEKHALIFGNEVNGISDDILDLLDLAVEIPQFGTKHSFNVAVSGGIVLWHYFIKKNTLHKK